MPKAYLPAVVVTLALFSAGVAAADQVPVIELQSDSGSASVQQPYYAGTSGDNGELLMLLQQLQDEVRSLRGMVEQQQYQIRRMEQDQRDRYRDLDRRISQGGQTPSLNSGTAQLGGSDAATISGASAPLAPLPAADSTPTDAQAYQAAFALVRQKSFAKALQAFSDFIQFYPDSARVPNAYYWIGEVNLAEQNLEPAKVAFQKVITEYSEHRKAPDATYKLGVIYHQMGDTDNAKKMFLQTQSSYPDSSAAGLAQDYLKR
ncbi:tol-pal system protein YbgF [Amphritea sp. HPY]|uniref:tol-pal system protein YbgF n=1 Tax=Amphritea sp. HPY TaxID=3421652 RepID=UPI003D7C9D63